MIKVAINGFGRIGRPVFRALQQNHPNLQVVAINDLTDSKTLNHLLKYDSVYGRYSKAIGSEIKMLSEKDPLNLPWKKLGVDVVLECSGVFTEIEGAQKHLQAGAKKVIISAPSKSDSVPTFVLGVNEEKYDAAKDNVVSLASCTTNCLAPVAKVLNDNFKIVKGFMTTSHAYTNDQVVHDQVHRKMRRGRAAGLNIIPTSSGASEAINAVIPKLKGRIDGLALRVPVSVGSIVDFSARLKKPADVKKINEAMKNSAPLKHGVFNGKTPGEQPIP